MKIVWLLFAACSYSYAFQLAAPMAQHKTLGPWTRGIGRVPFPPQQSSESRCAKSKGYQSSSRRIELRATRSDQGEDHTEVSHASRCPFSRKFPRYQIDLTSPAVATDKKEQGLFAGASWPWQSASTRNQLEAQAQKNHPDAIVKVLWEEKVDGVAAVARLWRAASDLLLQRHDQTSESSENDNTVVVVCALPNARHRVARQWVDLIEWLLSLDTFNAAPDLSVVYSLVGKVPTVTMSSTKKRPTSGSGPLPPSNAPSHEVVTARTKSWVKRILVELGICPFTKSVTMSGQGLADVGVPVGSIAYHTSWASSVTAAGVCELMADTWEAIDGMLKAGPKGKSGVSSILLAAPGFDENFALWSGPVFALLESGVLVAQAEKEIGVVCFHPSYATPDGSSFPGFGHMHSVPRLEKWLTAYRTEQQNKVEILRQRESVSNAKVLGRDLSSAVCPALSTEEVAAGGAWQRRTPHATINVLRADQLEAAEGRRSSPKLYAENILKLVAVVGSDKLQEQLDKERKLGG